MSDADKALFRGARDRNLNALVAPQANNPPIAAYPNFVATGVPGMSRLVVLRRSAAESVIAFIVGENGVPLPTRLSVRISEATEIPLACQRALVLNPIDGRPERTGAATTIDPAADPAAVIVDALWPSIPTFLVGQQRVGAVSRPTMEFIRFRRSAPQNRNVSFGLPLGQVPLHPADVTGAQMTLTTADVNDPTRVPVVMRAVHAYAVSKGYVAGFPAFGTTAQGLLQIIFLKDAEVIDAPTITIAGKPVWKCFDLQVPPSALTFVRDLLSNEWTPVGQSPSRMHVIVASGGQLVDSTDLPQPPAFVSVAIDTGGLQPLVIDAGGRPGSTIMGEMSAIHDSTTMHVLYYDGSLMHASRRLDGSDAWTSQVADGDGVGTHMAGPVGLSNALVIATGPAGLEVHAFYTTGSGALRHAQFDGTMWIAEDVDGHVTDNDGRVTTVVDGVSAVAEPGGRLHAFYHDFYARNLRHAERLNGTWRFEVLDGSGGQPLDGPGSGPISGWVGRNPAAALFDDRLYCFYDDYKNENIRMAVRRVVNGADRWSFRPLDGQGRGHGRSTSLVRSTSAVTWNDRLSVFYVDDDLGHLRHAWVERGAWNSLWNYEIVDGNGGSDGRVAATVGRFPVALAWGFDGVRATLPLVVAYQGPGPSIRWAVLSDPP